jgi:hypothetical protein
MKIILNNISKALMLGLFMMFAYSCADPDAKPILTFDDAIKGSYPRVTSEAGSAVISPLDVLQSLSFSGIILVMIFLRQVILRLSIDFMV